MKVEILGSGGALTTPRPGCTCRVCAEAREKGIPYARSGPSTFVHGPDVLIDTPEEIKDQLNRSRVTRIAACFYSHWHPDHTLGRRVFEAVNGDFRSWPPVVRGTTPVYLPEQVAADFRTRGIFEHFEFMVERRWVDVVELADGESVTLGEIRITPFRLAEDYVYAFLFEGEGKRLLLAPDELNGWSPPDWVRGTDLAVIPGGMAEFDPLTGERRIDAEHPVLLHEATFEETLAIVEQLRAGRVVLMHIDEVTRGLSYDELLELGPRHGVEFAYDGMVLDL